MRSGDRFPNLGQGRADDDAGPTLVIDEETELVGEQASGSERGGERRPTLPRLRLYDPAHDDTAGGRVAGSALTVIFLLAAAVSLTRMATLHDTLTDSRDESPLRDERVVYWTPELLQEPDRPSPPNAEPVRMPTRTPVPRSDLPAPGAGSPTVARDTAQVGEARPARPAAEGLLRPVAPGGLLPSAGRLGSAAADAAARRAPSGCVAPCREAAAVGIAPGTELARRDSILQAQMQSVVDRAGPPQTQGIYFPLPFGGPTKEERQRDSTLHADYRARLRAFMQRFDSAKADSLARGLIKP